ncbi:zinc finger protein 160-like [Osmerus eperlanus]|uniref:zinc finger protein 160-like n=1 Tax=Osmerus eperlanus TaxID=29151 RepID=UPI002E135E00
MSIRANMDITKIIFSTIPVSSVRVLVPPVRLVSAALWQVVERGNVQDYGVLDTFVTEVLAVIPDLMSYRDTVQLLMGLRARLVLELCLSDLVDSETIQQQLDRIRTCSAMHRRQEISDPDVETSVSHFLKLIETLLEQPAQREHYFRNMFPEEFGPKYDFALQTLVWEFLSRLDTLLPTPTLKQVSSFLSSAPSVLEELQQSGCYLKPLSTLLLNHNNTGGHSYTNGNVSEDNYILCTLSESCLETLDNLGVRGDSEVQSEAVEGCPGVQSPALSCIQSAIPLWSESSHTEAQRIRADQAMGVQTGPSSPEEEPEDNFEREDEEDTAVEMQTAKDEETDLACNTLLSDRNLETREETTRTKGVVMDESSTVISCLLHQPQVVLYRMEVTDELLSGLESTLTAQQLDRRKKKRVGEEGHPQGMRAKVVSRKSDFCRMSPTSQFENPGEAAATERGEGLSPLRTDQDSPSVDALYVGKRVKTCSRCGKSFSNAKDFTRHMIVHAKQIPHRCTGCGEEFDDSESLEEHQEDCHVSSHNEDSDWEQDDKSVSSLSSAEMEPEPGTLPQQKTSTSRPSPGQDNKRPCPICNKKLHRNSTNLHIRRCSKRNNLCCDCGKRVDLAPPSSECLGGTAGPDAREASCMNGTGVQQVTSTTNSTSAASTTLHSQGQPFRVVPKRSHRTCLLCNETFKDTHTMAEHLKLQHNLNPHSCPCGKTFTSSGEMEEHSLNCMSRTRCPSCRKGYVQSPQLSASQSVETILVGQQTDLQSTSVEDLMESQLRGSSGEASQDRHGPDTRVGVKSPRRQQDSGEEVHQNLQPGQEDQAHSSQASAPSQSVTDSPQPHGSTVSPQNQTPVRAPPSGVIMDNRTCPVCFKRFSNKSSRDQHIRRHEKGPFSCSICSHSFGCKKDLARHQAKVARVGCGPTRRNRTMVDREPAGEIASFKCSHCNAVFMTGKKLQVHMLYHTGDGFPCKYCGKVFSNNNSLMNHIKTHVDRSHLCETCGKGFAKAIGLKRHLPVHDDARPHVCTECGKSYKQETYLKSHIRFSHRRERPFPCTLCQMRFVSLSRLHKHMTCHSNKTFGCAHCGKRFKSEEYFKKHVCLSVPLF